MPYKVTSEGLAKLSYSADLTEKQVQALALLSKAPDNYFDSAEVANYYGYSNGSYFRGVMYSLLLKGFVSSLY